MIYFNNDYSEGCHPAVLRKLVNTNLEQTPGYGMDHYCAEAAAHIRRLCENDALDVHFLVGGTQTNLVVIDAALRPHQAALGAVSAHINVHETGAVEATGHKVLSVSSDDGKITAQQITEAAVSHRSDEAFEHISQPKMVYISNPTELGTIYTLQELEEISAACRDNGMYLFLDGARLGYGLTAQGNDVTLADLARLCDVFYIGGTKVGALFGEAVVFSNHAISEDFRYLMKQHGGMLAKGRLLGVQFCALMENGLYFEMGKHANRLADQIRDTLKSLGYSLLVPGVTNQVFAILPDALLEELAKRFSFTEQCRVNDRHRAVRFCTSWASTQANVDALCDELVRLSK
ncbi:MAG: aminotransferase class I/II-fold pyridoxal phosphate-dependent enzyme [Oscillospiraceae bacterium]|nr:aminotransferase class I/II-fold pyridoxal phosphate-dependent enzyme [Oscillospiraceae bacterium]